MATAFGATGPMVPRLPLVFVSLLVLAWPAMGAAQGATAAAKSFAAAAGDARVRRIDKERAAIDRRLPSLRKASTTLLGCSLEGAGVTSWTVRDKVLRLDAAVYGETYRAIYRFYYRDGEPIFVSGKVLRYDGTFGRVVATQSHRLYLERGEAIRVTTASAKAIVGGDDATRLQAEVGELSRCLLLRLRE